MRWKAGWWVRKEDMEEDEEEDSVDDVSVSGSTWRVILERWYFLKGAR